MSSPFRTARFVAPAFSLALCALLTPAARAQAAASGQSGELAAAQAHARALAERAGTMAIDSTPPVLRAFNLSGSIDAQTANPSIEARVRLSDNLSGTLYYYMQLRSPSGTQLISRGKSLPAPNTSINGLLTVGSIPYGNPPFTRFSEPGVWVADYFYAYDANGNTVSYSEAQLDALGTHTFVVTNAGGYDIVAPVFEQATILTPTVKLSKPPPGTPAGTTPYVTADVSVTDSGNGAISGAYAATLAMCRSNGAGGCSDTISLNAVTNLGGQSANTMRVGAQLRADQATGAYKAYYIYLQDIAGNTSVHFDVDFGGDIDFDDFFTTSPTIFVNS